VGLSAVRLRRRRRRRGSLEGTRCFGDGISDDVTPYEDSVEAQKPLQEISIRKPLPCRHLHDGRDEKEDDSNGDEEEESDEGFGGKKRLRQP